MNRSSSLSSQKRHSSYNDEASIFDCQRLYTRRSYTLNSLWSVWYCTIAMAFQIYIIAKSIQRFTGYLSLPWPNGQPPFSALNAYVILIGIGVIILPFFVVVAMMKVGNYSNDGYKLGDHARTNFSHSTNANLYQNVKIQEIKRKKKFRSLRLIWQHSIPTAPFLHMIAAMCFLLPHIIMEAILIKHGFIGKGNVWKTELDFILNKLEDKRVGLLSFLNTISDNERGLLNMDSYTVNQYLMKEQHISKQRSDVVMHLEESGHLSLEMINLTIALFVLAVRYPSVFWRANKAFGLIFSFQMTFNLVQSLLIYSGFQILLKVIICGPEIILVGVKRNLMLTSFNAVISLVIYMLMTTLSSMCVYMYGIQKYKEWKIKESKKFRITWHQQKHKLFGYFPHFCALLMLLLMGLSVVPILHDLTLIYCGSLDVAVLVAMISTVTHLLFWIIIWFILTLKNKWKFIIDNDKNIIHYSGIFDKTSTTVNGEQPLLIIENGHTYQIRESHSKRTILSLAQKSHIAQKHMSPDENEDIYWLKPKQMSPKEDKSPNDENSITWLKNQCKNECQKTDDNKNNNNTYSKGILRRPSKKSCKISPKQKKNKSEDGIDLDILSDGSDGEYATLRQIVNNKLNDQMPTHTNLCPLRDETLTLPNPIMLPTTDGDYELLVEHSYNNGHTSNANFITTTATTEVAPIHSNVVIHTDNNQIHLTSTPLSHAIFNKEQIINNDSLTPRSGSISETSNSPEKSSDTSSGVHSNSSNCPSSNTPSLSGDKRSASMEDMVQQIQSMPTNPCFKSLSLQRYLSSMTPGKNIHPVSNTNENTILSIGQSPNTILSIGQNPSTMVIRRMKKPFISDRISSPDNVSTEPHFGRSTNIKMTSFTDNGDFFRSNSLPCSPKTISFTSSTFSNNTPNINNTNNQLSHMSSTLPNQTNQNIHKQLHYNPVVNISPQFPPNSNSYTDNVTNFIPQHQRRNSDYHYSLSSCHNGIYS